MMAAANGIEFEESSGVSSSKGQDDWMKPPNERYYITSQDDLAGFEYGLGYEVSEVGQ